MNRYAEIAIIGMAGRFPGANSLAEFWENLRNGVESISFFSTEELEAAQVEPARVQDPGHVKAGAVLDGVENFDAPFFGMSVRDAEITDPQHRLFLECAWEALENAGCDSAQYEGLIGVFAGAGMNTYLLNNLLPNRPLLDALEDYQVIIGSEKDYLATRVSYKLNLKGPSVTVQTACSTSLVAVHLACRSLLNHECDMALAGGVSVRVPQVCGYSHKPGGIFSPDGHTRAFDANAQGTLFGSGLGVVVLKPLVDALRDRDAIRAVIKGSALNNDGGAKCGITAPSEDGQAWVIARALEAAGVEPESVTYVEAHGTGTAVGDPVELRALTRVFQARTQRRGWCAVGTVKTNVGHLDAAAGVTGLIKTVLALEHKQLPASLHFETPNPAIPFADSPFQVSTRLADWPAGATARRAGVTSLGFGGTNVHVVLEEAPALKSRAESRPCHLLPVSARSAAALETATRNLVSHLQSHPDSSLADVACTLQAGRREFSHRRMVVCRSAGDAVTVLGALDPRRVFMATCKPGPRAVAFMFPGHGSQYVHMLRGLYETEPVFREQVDRCSETLRSHLGFDLRRFVYPTEEAEAEAAGRLEQTVVVQPALFVVSYALARLWMQWGVQPDALIGYSIGEYVAACLAGVFSLEDALAVVATRAALVQRLPPGAMLGVGLPEQETRRLLDQDLSLAAVSAPSHCVVAGPPERVEALQQKLERQGVSCRRLRVAHAFHSHMLDPILEEYRRAVAKVDLKPPNRPLVSSLTGAWMRPEEATTPDYWVRELRHPVNFSDGVRELARDPARIFLEVGPSHALSALTRGHTAVTAEQVVLPSCRHAQNPQPDREFLLSTLGKLWLTGRPIDWAAVHAGEERRRVPLPTYPFERERYWIEPKERILRALKQLL